MQALIRVENLTAGYDDTVILEGLNFFVRRGEIFAILGGSGSGKSTLLKEMIGLYRPLSGRVLIEGEDIAGATGEDRRRILRQFGVMYQNGALFGSRTLYENVCLPLEEFTDLPPDAMERVALMKLKLVGLRGFENHMPAELSGGMQKRAAIARAMALDPKILFLDEPSAGLDPVTSAGIDQLILGLSRNLGITFVIVTHELASIATVVDRAIMLDREDRGITAEGTPDTLRHHENPKVRRFFGREPEDLIEADVMHTSQTKDGR